MRPDVVITPEAAEEIVGQIEYYHRKGSPAAAERWAARVGVAIDRLAAFPGIGEPLDDPSPHLIGVRVGRVEKFPHHIVVYRPFEGGIEVLAVTHGSRDLRRRL